MARLPRPRAGNELRVRDRVLPFSFFPVTRGTRRYGLFDTLFATSPWAVMTAAVSEQVCSSRQDEARAFIAQARDFYAAAAARTSANPLLYYYAFLNVAKALIRVRGYTGSLDQAMHGLSAQTAPGGSELRDSVVLVKDTGSSVNIYPELVTQLGFGRPINNSSYSIVDLVPQVVVGHRLWRQATRLGERFIGLERVEIVVDDSARSLWLRLYIAQGDLSRYSVTRQRLLDEGRLSGVFREVASPIAGYVCLEQMSPLSYSGRPTDVVMELIAPMRSTLWRIATTVPEQGYRKYYLHLSPRPASSARVPQLASLWLLFYYFGSVVRYRPHLFASVLDGDYGPFVAEFVSAQSEQFLYLLASEMIQREVARPAII